MSALLPFVPFVIAACAYMVRDGIRSGREADRIDAYFSRRMHAPRGNRA